MTYLHPKARERLNVQWLSISVKNDRSGLVAYIDGAELVVSELLREIGNLSLAQKEADAKVCDLEAAKRLNFGLTEDAGVAVACAKAIRATGVS